MNNMKVELKQREHLVSLVQEARNREKQELEEKNGATREAVISQVAESKGLNALLKKIEPLKAQVRKLEFAIKEIDDEIEQDGFDRENGRIVLKGSWAVPKQTADLIDGKLESARRPIEKSLKRYDLAVSKIWLATSGEELQKAIEGLF